MDSFNQVYILQQNPILYLFAPNIIEDNQESLQSPTNLADSTCMAILGDNLTTHMYEQQLHQTKPQEPEWPESQDHHTIVESFSHKPSPQSLIRPRTSLSTPNYHLNTSSLCIETSSTEKSTGLPKDYIPTVALRQRMESTEATLKAEVKRRILKVTAEY
jgi:hypothetical protein